MYDRNIHIDKRYNLIIIVNLKLNRKELKQKIIIRKKSQMIFTYPKINKSAE
jgi:hypothetical protein